MLAVPTDNAPLDITATSSSAVSLEILHQSRVMAFTARLLLTVQLITTVMNSTSASQVHPQLVLYPTVHATPMAHAPLDNTATSLRDASMVLLRPALFLMVLAIPMVLAQLASTAMNLRDVSMVSLSKVMAFIARPQLIVPLTTTATSSISAFQELPQLDQSPMEHATLMDHAPLASTAMNSSVALMEPPKLVPFLTEHATLMVLAPLVSTVMNSSVALMASLWLELAFAMLMALALLVNTAIYLIFASVTRKLNLSFNEWRYHK